VSIDNITKINQLISNYPAGIVFQSSWLERQGYSLALQQRYRKSGWLQLVERGALIRPNDKVGYEGALYALQTQSEMTVHPGGKTALNLLGRAHYLELSSKKVTIFGGKEEKLPGWFKKHDWGLKVEYFSTSFLPGGVGLVQVEIGNFSLQVSGPPRAILECLYLAPKKIGLQECYELMEGLNDLNPYKVQQLLEECTSIKVKRLFLYFAERAGHAWFKKLDLKKIDLGSGKRSVVKNGTLIEKYQITVPKELAQDDKASV